MNDKYTTFKAKVGIDEIASYLGYKLDRRAGVGGNRRDRLLPWL